MKRRSHTHEICLFEPQDLLQVLKDFAQTNAKEFTLMLTAHLSKQGYKVKRIQKDAELNSIIAECEREINEGVELMGKPVVKVERSSNAGFTRNFNGFYQAVIDIINEYHDLKELSFDELYQEVLKVEEKGKKKFWTHNGVTWEPMERSRFMQYLAPSQIAPARNIKFRGIRVTGTGLAW